MNAAANQAGRPGPRSVHAMASIPRANAALRDVAVQAWWIVRNGAYVLLGVDAERHAPSVPQATWFAWSVLERFVATRTRLLAVPRATLDLAFGVATDTDGAPWVRSTRLQLRTDGQWHPAMPADARRPVTIQQDELAQRVGARNVRVIQQWRAIPRAETPTT